MRTKIELLFEEPPEVIGKKLAEQVNLQDTIAWLEKQSREADRRFAAALGITVEEWLRRIEECKLKSRRAGANQADALIDAGWRFEIPEIVNHDPANGHDWSHTESEPWQWYWRAPAKRKGSKGRKYLSTNQAYRAMCKMNGREPIFPG